ncbi:MAG: RidA family protein [Dehalococcoidia bacterium]|nr:RidA family protein [Dehalococcoidia bacterium]
MTIERYNPGNAVRPASYSQAVKAGNTVYVSGQVAWDDKGKVVGRGDIAAQTEQVMQNLKQAVELTGGALSDVVKLTTFITNPAYTPAVLAARSRYFPQDPPASTLLAVNALALPELLVEIEAVAVLSPKVRHHFNPASPPGQRPSYSQAVQADDVLYVSGQVAFGPDRRIVGPGDLLAQAEQTLANVAGALSLAGADIRRVAMVRNFLINPLLFPPFLETYRKHFRSPYPANTTVMVSALAFPELMVETEAIVSLSKDVEFIEPSWTGKPQEYTMATRIGNTLYVSGQVGRDRQGNLAGPGNIAAQVEQAFVNMGIVLNEAGVGYKDVLKLTAFLTNPALFPQYAEGRQKYFPQDPPASTTAVVPALARPDFLVEVEAIAVVP